MNVLDRFRLDGKRLFVTGGSRGFGRAIALAAAEAGADIVLNGRDPATLTRTAGEVRERGRQVAQGEALSSMVAWASLPVGVVTLAERFGGVTVTRGAFAEMVEAVAAELHDFTAAHGGDLVDVHMLGTSGTVTTIAGVFLNLMRYDRRKVDGCWLRAEEITGVIERLMAMSYHDRAANPCIGIERADLVLTGCAILEAIRRAFPCPRLRVADRGLREGMLVQMMRVDGVWDGAEAP